MRFSPALISLALFLTLLPPIAHAQPVEVWFRQAPEPIPYEWEVLTQFHWISEQYSSPPATVLMPEGVTLSGIISTLSVMRKKREITEGDSTSPLIANDLRLSPTLDFIDAMTQFVRTSVALGHDDVRAFVGAQIGYSLPTMSERELIVTGLADRCKETFGKFTSSVDVLRSERLRNNSPLSLLPSTGIYTLEKAFFAGFAFDLLRARLKTVATGPHSGNILETKPASVSTWQLIHNNRNQLRWGPGYAGLDTLGDLVKLGCPQRDLLAFGWLSSSKL